MFATTIKFAQSRLDRAAALLNTKSARLGLAAVALGASTLAGMSASAVEVAPASEPINTIERIIATNTIRVGHREAAIPFSYMDANGRPIGYAIDLCSRIVAAARRDIKLPNLKVEYVKLSAADRIPALLDGRIDLECGNTTNTPARREKIAFTIPHFLTGAKILTSANAAARQLSDLEGKKVAVAKGTTAEGLIAEHNSRTRTPIQVMQVKDNSQAFAAVSKQEASAWMTDDILLQSYRANRDQPNAWSVNPSMLSVEPLAIAMRKDAKWKEFVDRNMSRVMIDGDIHAIYAKWFTSPTPPKNVNLNVAMSPLLRATFMAPSDKGFN